MVFSLLQSPSCRENNTKKKRAVSNQGGFVLRVGGVQARLETVGLSNETVHSYHDVKVMYFRRGED